MTVCLAGHISVYAVPGVHRIEIRDVRIIEAIEKVMKVEYEQMTQKKRDRELVLSRQLFFYFMRKHTTISLGGIGLYFNKDHATVLYSIRAVENLLETDKGTRKLVAEIEAEILNNNK